jgi:Cu/Ag efflux pump CusA
VLVTAIATTLALLPFMLSGDAPGFEVARPMGTVVLGCLITTLLANLFILPGACALLASRAVTAETDVLGRVPAPLAVASGAAD